MLLRSRPYFLPTKVNIGLEAQWLFDTGQYLLAPLGNGSGVTRGPGRPFFNGGKFKSYKSAGGDYLNDGVALYPFDLGRTSVLSKDFTVTAWFKTPGVSTRGVIFCNTTGASILTAITIWTNKVSLWQDDSGPALLSTSTVNDNLWHQVAATSSSALNTTRIYLDGILNCTPIASVVGTRTLRTLIVGNLGQYANNNYGYDGEIDDVRYYSRALTAQEVNMLYNEAFQTAVYYEVLPPLTVGPSFIAAWAQQSNLPVIGAGTY